MMKKFLAALIALMLIFSCALSESYEDNPVGKPTHDTTPDESAAEGEAAITAAEAAEAPSPVAVIAQFLARQEYTLEINNSYTSTTLHLNSADGKTVCLTVYDDEETLLCELLLDSERVILREDGESTVYTYPDVLARLFDMPQAASIAEHIFSSGITFDSYDYEFLQTAGKTIHQELVLSGAFPAVKHTDDGLYITLSLTPALIENAAMRFMEQMFAHEAEIDFLLNRIQPSLQVMFPEWFEQPDPETGRPVCRNYTCADLRELFDQSLTDAWLSGRIPYDGAHLDVSCLVGSDFWRADANLCLSEDLSVWLKLTGKEDGTLEGSLEFFEERYSRTSERYEMTAARFDISGAITNSGLSLHVRPETPVSGFTGLRVNAVSDGDSIIIDAVTDLADFRLDVCEYWLDLAFAMPYAVLDAHLTYYDGYPQGSLIWRGDSGFYLKLNGAD